jgi:hypothetical protein
VLDYKERKNAREEEAVKIQNEINDIKQELKKEHDLR